MADKKWASVSVYRKVVESTSKNLLKNKNMNKRGIYKTGEFYTECSNLLQNGTMELLFDISDKLSTENLEKVLEFLSNLEK